MKSAEIIYLYENTFDSDVEITVDDVSGGVEVSLFSEGSQSIYYTTDGTVPTTKSKTYESPFTLTNAGNYTVEAVAYNGSDYGSVYNESINIGQTTSPSISCTNGVVTITAEDGADIYYNTSLTPPAIGSNLYSGAFTISESTYVSAIAVKNGYAKSNTVSMYCVGTETKEDYQPLADSYSFNNERKSFGYSMVYKIPESTYISVFGETLGKVIYNENAFNEEGNLISWKGSCFGIALTSALFYTNGLTANVYCDEDYENIYAIEAPGLAEASLTKLIERCQVSQFLPIIQTEMFSETEDCGNWVQSGYGDLSNIVSAAQNCMNEPIIIYINRLTGDDSLYGHAVLPYKVENSSESEDVYNIYIYDCDSPNTDDGENYITVDLSSNTFSYYNGTATYDFSISYVKLSSLIENDTVSLLQDDDLENNSSIMNNNFLFVANSKDISIYNTSGVEAGSISGAVKYGTIGTEETSGVMWLLPDNDYTVVNNDSSIENFEVKVVDETDSFALSTDKVSSTVKFGRYGDRLYISSSSSGKANITVNTYNSTKKENSVSLYSNYVYVKPYNDNIIELYTNTDTIEANDIEYTLDTYSGSFVSARYMILISKNSADEVNNKCEISVVSKPKISDGTLTGNLKLNLINNGEVLQSGTLYIALYDEDTNKILAEQSQKISSLLSNENRTVSFDIDIDLPDASERYILKILFWNDNMQPISDIIELTY
ncbi:MAG: chitobiase/beta-hexosaminidase C-terminal domain-containing protein [Clostridiales bacterium]|nr:chitobiase/beta-hexosaminidase C-terminal domain-containing protein [Clostridiales bacterium]